MVAQVVAYDVEGNERADYWSEEVYMFTLELTTGEEIDILREDLDGSTEQLLLDVIETM